MLESQIHVIPELTIIHSLVSPERPLNGFNNTCAQSTVAKLSLASPLLPATLIPISARDPSCRLMVLPASPLLERAAIENRVIRQAYPPFKHASYQTIGTVGKVIIANHLSFTIYVFLGLGDVSETRPTELSPGRTISWSRKHRQGLYEQVLVTPKDMDGEIWSFNTAVGKILHIQRIGPPGRFANSSSPVKPITHTTPEECATKCRNIDPEATHYTTASGRAFWDIGVVNQTRSCIFVSAARDGEKGKTWNPSKRRLKPFEMLWITDKRPECLLLVTVGTSSAAPRMYLGKPGLKVNIYMKDHLGDWAVELASNDADNILM